jgi:hypothetical protein
MQKMSPIERLGVGLAVMGIGIALFMGLPPPWWPEMPPTLVHLGVSLGVILILVGAFLVFASARDRHLAVIPLKQRLKRMWPQYLMVFGACLFAVGFVAYLQLNVTPPKVAESAPEPASAPPPPRSAEAPVIPQKYTGEIAHPGKVIWSHENPFPMIQIGFSNVIFAPGAGEFGELILPALRREQFLIETTNGQIKVSTRVTDAAGNLIVEIIRNEWKVSPPPGTWDRNYNSNSLEVKDPKGHIILQVTIWPDMVQLQGAWHLGPEWKPAGMEYVIVRADPSGNGAEFGFYPYNPKPEVEWPEIKPLFKYPSERHLGELAEQ